MPTLLNEILLNPDIREAIADIARTVVPTPTPTPVVVPGAPTLNVAAGNAQAVLTFTDSSAGGGTISAHKVYRGVSAGGESLLGTVTTGSPYTDTGLTNGTTYYYRLSAVNEAGEGPVSAEQSATPAGTAPSLAGSTVVANRGGLLLTAPFTQLKAA